MEPVKAGDRMASYGGEATVLEVLPYTGRFPEFFNVVLVLSSTVRASGKLERAYNDPALRQRPNDPA